MTESHTDAGTAGRRHSEMAPELRQLAQTILDRLDPAVRMAAARAAGGTEGKCQQVWCPVCALAALISGEQHPLLTVIAEHSVALLAVVRAMADAMDTAAGAEPPPSPGTPEPPTSAQGPGRSGPDAPGPDGDPPPPGPGRYEHIPVTVED